MTDEIWLNTEFVLFQDKGGEKIFLDCVSIERIIWKRSNEAKLILRGRLPQASNLLSWRNAVCLELLRSCCTIVSYEANAVVFKFYGKIKRKWTPHFIPSESKYQSMVDIYVSLECTYEMFFETEG
jgi:hypothetical protein